jgi:AcrR family transcriptional regulator
MARKPDPNKRKTLLQAAARVFARKGYAATRIIEVADAAKVGKGTIYQYFPSKEELLFCVFEAVVAATGEAMTQTAQHLEGSFSKRLRRLSDSMMESWLEQLEFYALTMEFWSASASMPSRERFKTVFRDGYRRLRSAVKDLIVDAQAAGDVSPGVNAHDIASAVIGTWDALLLQAWLDPDFDALRVSRQFMDVMLRGLDSAEKTPEPN